MYWTIFRMPFIYCIKTELTYITTAKLISKQSGEQWTLSSEQRSAKVWTKKVPMRISLECRPSDDFDHDNPSDSGLINYWYLCIGGTTFSASLFCRLLGTMRTPSMTEVIGFNLKRWKIKKTSCDDITNEKATWIKGKIVDTTARNRTRTWVGVRTYLTTLLTTITTQRNGAIV